MENIFYAVLALHIAGKPINEENIRRVLKAAGVPVNEPGLQAMAAFVNAIQSPKKKETVADERIIKFLASELAYSKERSKKLEEGLAPLLERLKKPGHSTSVSEKTKATPKEPVSQETEPVGAYRDTPLPTEEKTTIAHEPRQGKAVSDNGRYIYGIADKGEKINLGKIGIENSEVYTIPYKDICAIVHNCPAEPYKSEDNKKVEEWIMTHQKVLEVGAEKFDTILPMGFDTIIQSKPRPSYERGKDNTNPTQVVKDWLKEDSQNLKELIKKVKGKDEYGVKIFYDQEIMGKKITEESEEIKKLKKEIESKPKGMAYMYRQKLGKAIKQEMGKRADQYFKSFFQGIKRHVEEIKIGKTKKTDENKVMIMNLSCLVLKDKVKDLGDELERINNLEGFSVRFTGPWPPYSFITKPAMPAKEE
ncbi:MAG: GvpL/GvpF family gas vesicle protein [bacterium]|nr:GvpL/GvpF family gas vesicle protein [bacterium]